jgi:hypothetical protein
MGWLYSFASIVIALVVIWAFGAVFDRLTWWLEDRRSRPSRRR